MSFEKAAEDIKAKGKDLKLSDENMLKLYGLYKQATVGNNNTEKPSFYQIEAKAKWNAWEGNKGKSQEQAKVEYIAVVEGLIAGKK